MTAHVGQFVFQLWWPCDAEPAHRKGLFAFVLRSSRRSLMSNTSSSASGSPAAPCITCPSSTAPPEASSVNELVLRFSCPTCQHRLLVPVRHLGKQSKCPHCSNLVQAPPLTPQVAGYDIVAKAPRPTPPSPPAASAPMVTDGPATSLDRFPIERSGSRNDRTSPRYRRA
jgi:hypothetical protein